MFTQCPQCETIFRLSAEALGAAGGQVRCGRCGEVFDALLRLAEEPRMFVVGETTLELERRAEKILKAAEAPAAEPPAGAAGPSEQAVGAEPAEPPEPADDEWLGTSGAGLELVDEPAADIHVAEHHLPGPGEPEHAPADADTSLEFSISAADLDRIFVSTGTSETFEHDEAALLERIRAEAAGLGGHEADVAPEPAPEPPAELPPIEPAAPDRGRLAWLALAAALALALVAQVVHRNREVLAGLAPFGPALRSLYTSLGQPLPALASLAGYQLRQWGASGDAGGNGTLRVRASILNISDRQQPFPLLRVTLADRFGAHVGSREFDPADYLGRPVTRLLGPGEHADATIDIEDPGKDAESFELDVCLRNADGRVHCAGDAAPHTP